MSVVSRRVFFILCLVLGAFAAAPAAAQTANGNGITEPSIATSLPQNGDPAGARKRLAERGFTYYLIYTNDVLSNLSGGTRRGTIDQGKLWMRNWMHIV